MADFVENTAFEQHYKISELARMWGFGRETIRKLVKDDPDVLKARFGRKKSHTSYSVPASIAKRIHTRLLNPS
jgi:nucleotidyltransferase/DNA polymerase involved in DNA repair